MNILMSVAVTIIMAMMTVVPLLLVLYLGNERSKAGVLALVAALIGGTMLGFAIAG